MSDLSKVKYFIEITLFIGKIKKDYIAIYAKSNPDVMTVRTLITRMLDGCRSFL